MLRRIFVVAFLTAAALAVPAKPPSSTPKPPSIILITLDTTRADRMGFMGSKRGLTPNLDALAKQSAVFTHAYSQAPLTPPSHATILTGTYPQFHHVLDLYMALPKDVPYAPDILRARGYHTAAFVSSVVLDPHSLGPGFDRGFDLYDAGFHEYGPGEDRYQSIQRRGSEVVARALAWLTSHPKGPYFLWVHLYDAHDPYDPPEPYKSRYAGQPYDGAIAYQDAVVGKLLRQLKLQGLYDSSVIAVMADHGESLGAHGEDNHGIFLYDETIQVPLVIKLPGDATASKRIENRVELVDVLPTLLEAVDVKIPAEVQGQSLLGLMKMKEGSAEGDTVARAWRNRPAYSQTDYTRIAFGWSSLQSLRTGNYLYIQAPRRELYDETADPNAERNLAPASPATADTIASQLQTLLQKTTSNSEAPEVKKDPAAQEKLAALGYESGGNAPKDDTSEQRPDPKDKIEIAATIHRADMLHFAGRYDEAIALLQQAIAKEAPPPILYSKLGMWLIRQGRYQDAVPVMRKAVAVNPDSIGAHFHLARSLVAIKEYDAAIPELESLVAKMPNWVEAHSLLQWAFYWTKRFPEAIRECRVVLHYDPEDYGSFLILGQSLALSGDVQGGEDALKKAISLQPENPMAHIWLSEVYNYAGRKADAARERAKGIKLGAIPEGPAGPEPSPGPVRSKNN